MNKSDMQNPELVFTTLQKMLHDQLGIEIDDISMDSRLDQDLHLDSLDVVEFIMDIEQAYTIEINEDELPKKSISVQDVVKYITEQVDQL